VHHKIVTAAALFERTRRLRVVFTNGCFDILHRGHVEYLHAARQLGDALVVALNSDRSVRRLKGADRPVNAEHDRAVVLAALASVDHVVLFDEDTPVGLVELLQPSVYVKGADYRDVDFPEARAVRAYGGAVRFLPYVDGHSSTATIARLGTGDGPVMRDE
jgi:rfaE bifunctional protein nucleotidyltransferase chain/domain